MEGQITLATWQQWREEIKEKLNQTVENFIFIGYRLRQIDETQAFKQGGYASLQEFAQAELNLSASTVSRFMAISAKFTIEGRGQQLLPSLEGMAYSKLQEMLTLSDADCELITPQTTVKDIKELKRFNHADPNEERVVDGELSHVQVCIKDFFANPARKEIFNEILRGVNDIEDLVDRLNPAGNLTHRCGLVYMFFYDVDKGVGIKLMTSPMPRKISYREFLSMVYELFVDHEDEKDPWKSVYGEVKEEEKKPAPAAVAKTAPKPAPQKPKNAQKTSTESTFGSEDETQVEGQKNIMDYPEYVPDSMREGIENTEENTIEEVEEVPEDSIDASEIVKNVEKTSTETAFKAPTVDDFWEAFEIDHEELAGFMKRNMWEGCGVYRKLSDIPLEERREAYNHAINLAAGLEKILNV
ncbi:MAG: hypothetical protein E7287_05040 [Lachnospiraceae bacterium]|nr:hypothetical protein [Lachnospiraceae bacterium]